MSKESEEEEIVHGAEEQGWQKKETPVSPVIEVEPIPL